VFTKGRSRSRLTLTPPPSKLLPAFYILQADNLLYSIYEMLFKLEIYDIIPPQMTTCLTSHVVD